MGFWDFFRWQTRAEEPVAKDTTFTGPRPYIVGGVDQVTSKELAMKIATVFPKICWYGAVVAQLIRNQ